MATLPINQTGERLKEMLDALDAAESRGVLTTFPTVTAKSELPDPDLYGDEIWQVVETNTHYYALYRSDGTEWLLQQGVPKSISGYVPTSQRGVAGGIATLNDQQVVEQDVVYNGQQTVRQALDSILNPLSLSLSGGGNYEVGRTITTVNLSWSINKEPAVQSLNQGIGELDPTLRSYTGDAYITSNTTYRITIETVGGESANAKTHFRFRHRQYWGINPQNLAAQIDAGSDVSGVVTGFNSRLKNGRNLSTSVDASAGGGGNYFYVAYPARFGGASFVVNGLSVTGWARRSIDITNSLGHTETYYLYQSPNVYSGAGLNVAVS